MKISKKQKQEIDFLEKFFVKGATTQEQREEYIQHTVHGQGNKTNVRVLGGGDVVNPLDLAKISLDRSIKMWREDFVTGLLGADELKEDFENHPYAIRMIDGIIKGVTREYRYAVLSQKNTWITSWAFLNFPDVMKTLIGTTDEKKKSSKPLL